SSTPSISRTTPRSSSAPRRSRPSSPASTEVKTDASRQSFETRPPHGKGQQAQLRARPVHVRGLQGRQQAPDRRGRGADLQGHGPRRNVPELREKKKPPPPRPPGGGSLFKKAHRNADGRQKDRAPLPRHSPETPPCPSIHFVRSRLRAASPPSTW